MRARVRVHVVASVAIVVGALALPACPETRPSKRPSSPEVTDDAGAGAGAGSGSGPGADAGVSVGAASGSAAPVSSSAMPPPTPKKAGCLDSTRGAKHTFVGKLEKHPNGSGDVRVHLPKKVCFSGGRFSAGDTDEVILDIEDWKAKPLLTKKVKVSGTSQDFAPATKFAYVMRLEVTALAAAK